MINFVPSTPSYVMGVVSKDEYKRHFGLFCSPTKGYRPEQAVAFGTVWAADNGCFTGYNPELILKMLIKYQGIPNCKFVVVPDLFDREQFRGDAYGTLLLFNAWIGTYKRLGYPAAFVLQNDFNHYQIPFDSIDAIFIGGDTRFKFSSEVACAVADAKRRGKWVHMGRVNSPERIIYARSIGCDSFDGTGYALNRNHVRSHLPYHSNSNQQHFWELIS
jgi:hypothetical protein